jgi:hypothetical protein
LSYLLSQGVKEGLVRHPEDWPGVHCVSHLLGGGRTRCGAECGATRRRSTTLGAEGRCCV